MFALAVIDKLTPGGLTDGRFIAGTGTITPDGQVGPIGGIPFKMRAARDAGATVFLVPADNCGEAEANAPAGLELVRVATLQDALNGLGALATGRPTPSCTAAA
jgi:PDZ domain-containing protein